MPLAMLLLLAAADAPPVIVVERVSLGLKPAEAAAARQQLVEALRRAGLGARPGDAACPDRPCLHALAKGWSAWLVGVSVAKSKKGLTFDLEAVDAQEVLAQQAFLHVGKRLDDSPDVEVFLQQLLERRRPPRDDRPVAEAPRREPALDPPAEVRRPEPAFDVEDAPAPASPAPKVLGVAAAGLGALGAGLLVGGLVAKGDLDARLASGPVVQGLTRQEAQAQADLANALMASGAALLGLGAAGGTAAVVLSLP